jgi:Protein of unknown function (DUF2934)
MQRMEIERDEQIRQLAYRIWQEEGYPHGYEVQHWLKAETIWQEEHRPHSEPEYSKPVRSKRTKGQSNRNRRKTIVIPRH